LVIVKKPHIARKAWFDVDTETNSLCNK